jgi:hypothetical protein
MLIELPFASFFLSKMLGQHTLNVDIDHLQSLDPELYKNLLYLKVPDFSYLFIRNIVSFSRMSFENLLCSSVSINQSIDFERIESIRYILKYDLSCFPSKLLYAIDEQYLKISGSVRGFL